MVSLPPLRGFLASLWLLLSGTLVSAETNAPSLVRLTDDFQVPVIMEGRTVGSFIIQSGTIVERVGERSGKAIILHRGQRISVPESILQKAKRKSSGAAEDKQREEPPPPVAKAEKRSNAKEQTPAPNLKELQAKDPEFFRSIESYLDALVELQQDAHLLQRQILYKQQADRFAGYQLRKQVANRLKAGGLNPQQDQLLKNLMAAWHIYDSKSWLDFERKILLLHAQKQD